MLPPAAQGPEAGTPSELAGPEAGTPLLSWLSVLPTYISKYSHAHIRDGMVSSIHSLQCTGAPEE